MDDKSGDDDTGEIDDRKTSCSLFKFSRLKLVVLALNPRHSNTVNHNSIFSRNTIINSFVVL